MAKVLVHDLDPAVVERLKARAARHGRSLQKELKTILEEAAARPTWAEARAAAERAADAGRSQVLRQHPLVREDRTRASGSSLLRGQGF